VSQSLEGPLFRDKSAKILGELLDLTDMQNQDFRKMSTMEFVKKQRGLADKLAMSKSQPLLLADLLK
jgi:hypothetical protein